MRTRANGRTRRGGARTCIPFVHQSTDCIRYTWIREAGNYTFFREDQCVPWRPGNSVECLVMLRLIDKRHDTSGQIQNSDCTVGTYFVCAIKESIGLRPSLV